MTFANDLDPGSTKCGTSIEIQIVGNSDLDIYIYQGNLNGNDLLNWLFLKKNLLQSWEESNKCKQVK